VRDSCTYIPSLYQQLCVCFNVRQQTDGTASSYDSCCVYLTCLRVAVGDHRLFQKVVYVHQHFVLVGVYCYVDIFGCRIVLVCSYVVLYGRTVEDS
jgi:hypothetical protein